MKQKKKKTLSTLQENVLLTRKCLINNQF